MKPHIARSSYNRACGLIAILHDMRLCISSSGIAPEGDMSKWTATEIQDYLYTAGLGDIIKHLETLKAMTPWAPTPEKQGSGYL